VLHNRTPTAICAIRTVTSSPREPKQLDSLKSIGTNLIVLLAAILHAGWNALLRGGGDRLWSMTIMCIAIALPCALMAPFVPVPAAASWGCVAVSALLHAGYNLFLVRTYRRAGSSPARRPPRRMGEPGPADQGLWRRAGGATRDDPQACALATIPGIGVINATAPLAAVGDASAFAKGRDFAAWLGLTPRQHSTGGKTRLPGISKRVNKYLRVQPIHGAGAAMAHFVKQATPTGDWVPRLHARAHPNVVIIALAAKLARVARAVLRHGRNFERQAAMAA
jgi:hypothetical protein